MGSQKGLLAMWHARFIMTFALVCANHVLAAVIEVTQGGGVSDATYMFSDSGGSELATLKGTSSALTASTDVVTGSGVSVNALATTISSLQAEVAAMKTVQARQGIPSFAGRMSVANQVTTLAGSGSAAFADGTGTSASFDHPGGVATSPDGTRVFVADRTNNRIRMIQA